ncbi:class F sortase [Phytohabitans sp. LJ34]|uniref:class F sortase n=1 Tax=Phytohabitans sp. LJ34 TaxID=3452217 RepID=UPI003F8C917F
MAPDRPAPHPAHRIAWWAGCAATVLVAAAGIWQIRSASLVPDGPPPLVVAPPSPSPTGQPLRAVLARRSPALDRSAPTKIVIPSINLRAALDTVGLRPDGTIETPPYERAHRAAWYRLGPAPGERGASVLVGHVDSKKAVAVFWYLTRIAPGDEIQVTREDRRTALFTVTSIEEFAKTAFPTARVYADPDTPQLRLVTCGGRWDPVRGEYPDNVIVFATLTGIA